MGVYLSLQKVSVLHTRGWGRVRNRAGDAGEFRIELRDAGELALSVPSFLGMKPVLSMSPAHLELKVGTEQVTCGGGWMGGGQGFAGALVGAVQAGVLNTLSTRTWEETRLAAYVQLPNGTTRDAVFVIHDHDESTLRDNLAAAIPAWADSYADAERTRLFLEPIQSRAELESAYAAVDRIHEHRLLDATQALTLCSEASEPLISGLVADLKAGSRTAEQIQNIRGDIDQLYQQGRITAQQAQRVQQHLDPPGPPPARTSADRTRQIETLAELRRIGALTEPEFQAEKARILDPAPPALRSPGRNVREANRRVDPALP